MSHFKTNFIHRTETDQIIDEFSDFRQNLKTHYQSFISPNINNEPKNPIQHRLTDYKPNDHTSKFQLNIPNRSSLYDTPNIHLENTHPQSKLKLQSHYKTQQSQFNSTNYQTNKHYPPSIQTELNSVALKKRLMDLQEQIVDIPDDQFSSLSKDIVEEMQRLVNIMNFRIKSSYKNH